ncbi:hypothetical protein [Paenibacillus crassostreae]|uniref:hypothetical protein n=1 Tax=Paenibacillus crassostreae TaxID=1763538 RepID=UPI0018E08C61
MCNQPIVYPVLRSILLFSDQIEEPILRKLNTIKKKAIRIITMAVRAIQRFKEGGMEFLPTIKAPPSINAQMIKISVLLGSIVH